MESAAAEIFVVMGVSGSGKTTIGTLLARRIHAIFADADDYHSPENKRKMHAGVALNDEDRAPWLASLNAVLRSWAEKRMSGVLACSALKASYRDILSAGMPGGEPHFVWLDGAPEMIAQRLQARQGTYMNPSLLGSQLATLEPPTGATRIVNDHTPAEVVDSLLTHLGLARLLAAKQGLAQPEKGSAAPGTASSGEETAAPKT